jgi:glycosyltransferase involved in cell wall biosynthesis
MNSKYYSVRQKSRTSNGTILLAVTPASACVFFEGIIGPLAAAGFRPILVSAPGEQLRRTAQATGAEFVPISMIREISPLKDLVSLWKLYRLMRSLRPLIADVSTPKAGLLGGLAALLAGVPCRIYTLRGLRLETTTGWKRTLLCVTERIAAACAHRVICVGSSLRSRAIQLKLVPTEKAIVLGHGSSGVDVQRFSPKARNSPERNHLAKQLNIPATAPVIGFVGRLTRDKGIPELLTAFAALRVHFPDLHLILVGDYEPGDPVPALTRQQIDDDAFVVRTGYVDDTAPYYSLMDVFVFPTHREGFGQASVEAQACGVPVVTTRATGVVDSLIDDLTGFVVPIGNTEMLATKVKQLLTDAQLRSRMGLAGRESVMQRFRQEVVSQALLDEYQRMLQGKNIQHRSSHFSPLREDSPTHG